MAKYRAKTFDTRCKSCDAEIVMVKLNTGKWVPCNREPNMRKIVSIDGDVVTGWRAHFATCKQPNRFRRPQRVYREG